MFTKAIFALFAVAARLAVAAPPACLLAAVNTQSNPSALQVVCSGSNATQVEQYICKNCGTNAQAALSDFASVCSTVGVKISNANSCSSISSSSASATKTGSASVTGTITAGLATGTSGSSGFTTATSSSSVNGTLTAPNGNTSPTATSGVSGGSSESGSSASGSAASATASSTGAYTGAAARLGMDIVGLVALGAFGVMMAV